MGSVAFGVGGGSATSPSLLGFPANAMQVIDHLVQRIFVGFSETLGDVLWIVGVRVVVGD